LLWKGYRFGLDQFEVATEGIEKMDFPEIPSNRRLGHQVEFIFGQLLKADSRYDLVAESIQVTDQKKTLGELDYILYDYELSQILHVELTYKFYLLDRSIPEPFAQLVGPNRSDTFLKKLAKVRERQFPLLFSDAARAELRKFSIKAEDVEQRVAFYGHIFTPIDDRELDIEGLNEGCVVGNWISRNRFDADRFGEYDFYLPSKSEWLHLPHDDMPWSTFEEIESLITEINQRGRSPMVWMRKSSHSIERLFVTFD